MKYLRSRRGIAGVGAIAALVCVTLLVVLPAVASSPGEFVNPPSGAGVLPYDVGVGGNGVCSNLFTAGHSLGAVKEYDNGNPKTATGAKSGNNDGVTFDVTVHNPSNTSQSLDVTAHGAAILGIGIKGGTQSTAYDYLHNTAVVPAGYVTSDTGLHAPLQNNSYTVDANKVESGSSFYSISLLNVCYTVLSYVQGAVYEDVNQNGANDDSSPRAGWTLNLYAGVTPGTAGGGTLVGQQVTSADGKYHFDVAANGTHYRVCEVSSGTPSNGGSTWVQTQPLPSTTSLCNGTNELVKGYDFTPTSSAGATDDFGNAGGYSCNNAPVGTGYYTVGTCKAGQLYVFNQGTVPTGNTNGGAPYVDYWVGDPNTPKMPVVEQLNFADPIVNGQPKYTKLLYDDSGNFPATNFNNLLQMQYCKVDPRTGAGYTLSTSYDELAESGAVLPTGQTSCVISIRTTAPAPGGVDGALQAYVYALGDSIKSPN